MLCELVCKQVCAYACCCVAGWMYMDLCVRVTDGIVPVILFVRVHARVRACVITEHSTEVNPVSRTELLDLLAAVQPLVQRLGRIKELQSQVPASWCVATRTHVHLAYMCETGAVVCFQ